MLNIILANNDPLFGIDFFNFIKIHFSTEINIHGIVSTKEQLTSCIKLYSTDIILFDLDFNNISFIELINIFEMNNHKIPKIILISSSLSKLENINNSYISDKLIKPINQKKLVKQLLMNNFPKSNTNHYKTFNKILDIFNFNTSSIGYRYLLEGLVLFTNINSSSINFEFNLKNDFYKNIYYKHNIQNINRIQWSIDKTISSMIKYTPKSTLKIFFPNTNKPSSKLVITKILDIYYKRINHS